MKRRLCCLAISLMMMLNGYALSAEIDEPTEPEPPSEAIEIEEIEIETPDSPLEPEPPIDEPNKTAPDGIIDVRLPASLDFIIDPFELAGLGSLYSREYAIENRGGSDVIITFEEVSLIFANETDFKQLPQPFSTGEDEPLKAIYMLLDFGREDVEPLVVTAQDNQPVSILLLAAGDHLSSCKLSISGNVNPEPAEMWADGDVRIRVRYRIEPVSDPDAALDVEEQDEEDEEDIDYEDETEGEEPDEEEPNVEGPNGQGATEKEPDEEGPDEEGPGEQEPSEEEPDEEEPDEAGAQNSRPPVTPQGSDTKNEDPQAEEPEQPPPDDNYEEEPEEPQPEGTDSAEPAGAE